MSNLIKQKILSAIDAIPAPKDQAPKIVLFLMEGESHEIGLLLGYYLAKELGWTTYYLGQNVPLSDINEVMNLVKPQLALTMTTVLRPNKTEKSIAAILKSTSVPLAISGGERLFDILPASKQIIVLKKPDDLIALLNQKKESFV